MAKILHADGDDWQAVYIDGKMVDQGHHIYWPRIIKILGHEVETKEADYEWLSNRGTFPTDPDEIQWFEEGS